MVTLGQHIRQLRKEAGLSLRECAGRLGISAQFLSDIELSRRYPSEGVLIRIANTLGEPAKNLRRYDTRVPFEVLRQIAAKDSDLSYVLRMLARGVITSRRIIDLVKREGYESVKPKKQNEKK